MGVYKRKVSYQHLVVTKGFKLRAFLTPATVPKTTHQRTTKTNSEGRTPVRPLHFFAEGMGFEPMRGCPLLAFQASALDHYANPPNFPNQFYVFPRRAAILSSTGGWVWKSL